MSSFYFIQFFFWQREKNNSKSTVLNVHLYINLNQNATARLVFKKQIICHVT